MYDECTWHHKNIPSAISVLTLGNKVVTKLENVQLFIVISKHCFIGEQKKVETNKEQQQAKKLKKKGGN